MAVINWTIDQAHSEIGFRIKHMMISWVRGLFLKFDGTVTTDGDDWTTAKVELDIDASSINTNEQQRDAHLRSADFFEVEKFPNITYESTDVKKVDDHHYIAIGNLTIHGITKEVTMNVEASDVVKDPMGNYRAGFTITGTLSRKTFGLTWNGSMPGGNSIIADDIHVDCTFEATHK